MPAPSTAITRLDLAITYQDFALIANLKKYIGLAVLPPLGVTQEGAEFLKIKIESLLGKVEDTKRAPRGTYAEDDWEWTTDRYAVEDHGVTEIVDDATIEKYGDVLRVEQIASMRGIVRVLQRLEYDIAAAVFDTSVWNNASLATNLSKPWHVANDCDPIADIDAAHEKVSIGCGEDANTFVTTKKGFTALIRSQRVESLLKYDSSELLIALNGGQNQNMVSEIVSGLKDLLNVEKILVGRGFKNTANKGLAASMSRMWDSTKSMLCCVHDDGIDGDLESATPQIGRTIFSTKNDEPLPEAGDGGVGSLIFDEYRDEDRRGGKIRPRNKRMVKILHKEAGHLLTNVTA